MYLDTIPVTLTQALSLFQFPHQEIPLCYLSILQTRDEINSEEKQHAGNFLKRKWFVDI